MKICRICNETKPLTEFYKKTDGYYNYACKPCHNSKVLKYRESKEGQKVFKKAIEKYQTKLSVVYEIVDDLNVCLYIGKSKRFLIRKGLHKRRIESEEQSNKSKQSYLYPLLRQHQNPQIRIVEECPPEVLIEREKYYIDTKKPLYNRNI